MRKGSVVYNAVFLMMLLLRSCHAFRTAHKISPHRQRCATQMCTSMGWENSNILSNKREAEGMRIIEVEASTSIAASYISAGQYVQIKKDGGKPGFYAMASPPDGRNIFTFLVKESESNAFLVAMKDGDNVEVSSAQGKGFQIAEYLEKYKFDFPVTNVLLMATGSGLAPIAAAIESGLLGLKETKFNSLIQRKATLYIGARSPQHIPFASKFPVWEEMGVKVIPVISQPPAAGWDGRTGYIQEALGDYLIYHDDLLSALLSISDLILLYTSILNINQLPFQPCQRKTQYRYLKMPQHSFVVRGKNEQLVFY